MTGPLFLSRIEYRIKRIGELTKKGLPTGVIAERMGMRTGSVYLTQIRHGFRKVEHPKKGVDKNDEAV